jgi:hypothetical protein
VSGRLPLLAATPFLLLGLAACGSSVLSSDTVEKGAADALEEQVGARPEVSCPEDLAAEVGAEARCTLTASDDPTEYGVTVTVTSLDGETANFDVQVDDQPQG